MSSVCLKARYLYEQNGISFKNGPKTNLFEFEISLNFKTTVSGFNVGGHIFYDFPCI